MAETVLVEVFRVLGRCPVFAGGERFRIEQGFRLIASSPVCLHALASVLPYYVALSRGVTPQSLGLAGPDGAAYVQCLDPQALTGGGTVTFRLTTNAAV
ncbi:MAG: TIGR04076 family protein [Chloroflexia bacterium]